MIILCDTSSILLLLRIAPDMFIDPVFECVTIHEVIKEIFGTPKFKIKYPWRTDFRGKVRSLPVTQYHTPAFEKIKKTIAVLLENVVINEKTQRMIGLSEEDQFVAACAIVHGYFITTGDAHIIAFLRQEFKPDFKGNLTALEVINFWLEKEIMLWDDAKHTLLAEWKLQGEITQPKAAIRQFIKLTGRKYPGT